MQKVKVVSIKDAGTFNGEVSGGTVNVTLQRGGDFVSCDGILIFEEEDAEYYFDELFKRRYNTYMLNRSTR